MTTAQVFANNQQQETISIEINGSQVTIDGPFWFGEGLLLDGTYIGRAYYKKHITEAATPLKPVFHQMVYLEIGNKYVGEAFFGSGKTELEWRL